tara:strand:+ start:1363 stop:1560 length:198 start_codon:yes stop_codon:yes gene_type:complete
MAFQGAGHAAGWQPSPVPAGSGYEAVLPVEKIKFDFYPIYDKSLSVSRYVHGQSNREQLGTQQTN